MKIHQLSVDEAFKSVNSSAQGLSSAEPLRRLREYGPNQIERVTRRHPALRLFSATRHRLHIPFPIDKVIGQMSEDR